MKISIRSAVLPLATLVLVTAPALADPWSGGLETAVGRYEAGTSLRPAIDRALAAGVDAANLESLVLAAGERGIPADGLTAWVETLQGLKDRALPEAPVFSRYLQGLAKGVPASRVDLAVADLTSRLDRAAARIDAIYPAPVSDPSGRLAAIDHAAYALGLGVTEADLTRSMRLVYDDATGWSDLSSPILTLGILVASGVTPDQSLTVVATAWESGYRGPALERLGTAVGVLTRDQESPGKVVAEVLELIRSDASQEAVFQGLDALMGRDSFRFSGTAPGDDPTIRRGDAPRETPNETPHKDNFEGVWNRHPSGER